MNVDGSIYEAGLVHQNSLFNFAGEYASIKTTDEIIPALGGSN
jgi:hypothetical protein